MWCWQREAKSSNGYNRHCRNKPSHWQSTDPVAIKLGLREILEAWDKTCLGFPKIWQVHILERRNSLSRWTFFKSGDETGKVVGLQSYHTKYTDQLVSFGCKQFLYLTLLYVYRDMIILHVYIHVKEPNKGNCQLHFFKPKPFLCVGNNPWMKLFGNRSEITVDCMAAPL